MAYQRDPVAAPRLQGLPLRLFVETLEGPLGRSVIRKISADSGIDRFRTTSAEGASAIKLPLHGVRAERSASGGPELAARAVELCQGSSAPQGVAAFARAFRSKKADPRQIADKVIAALTQVKSMSWMIASDPSEIRAQAAESARRIEEGRARSVFEGVPVAVKDEMDQRGYGTTVGTAFLGKKAVEKDATLVARLREAGAVLIGKAQMHEIGINPVGINPHHGAARNPWSRGRITGGSSSGPAALVGSGICPVAIGADGGGSIRIPAALCGAVGLKATASRISVAGAFPLGWHVGHVGPIGASVADVAASYAITAGPDLEDEGSLFQPQVELDALDRADLRGVRLGVCRPHFEDADPDVVARCKEALERCVSAGAVLVEIPPPDLNTMLWSHTIIILSEMATSMLRHSEEDSRRFGLDVRASLAIGRFFSATDLVHAQRHQTLLIQKTAELMRTVDAIVTPTTGITAPQIPEGALPEGESNLKLSDALLRFARLGNLTGFPAISVPAGFDRDGMPVGLQFMGRPWEEGLLLRLALEVERHTERRTPATFTSLLA